MVRKIFFFILCFAALNVNDAQTDQKPYLTDEHYGPFERNIFDFWKAETTAPAPLVIYIHGGGFNSGSKEKISEALVNGLLGKGISVMAINYRLTPDVVYPQHYLDCARAIQFAKYHAKEYNIDPGRIAAIGSSAGACTALWIGFHDDMADTTNPDPVLRMSTRLSGMISMSGQSILIPDTLRSWFGEAVMKHSFMKGAFFGINPGEVNSTKGKALYKEASPVTYLSADDPPVWQYYTSLGQPKSVSEAVHHIKFGEFLKAKMDSLNLECSLNTPENTPLVNKECIKFFMKCFGMTEDK